MIAKDVSQSVGFKTVQLPRVEINGVESVYAYMPDSVSTISQSIYQTAVGYFHHFI